MATTAPPPSYNQVVADIHAQLAVNPKDPQHVHDVLQSIPDEQKKVILNEANVQASDLKFTPEQEKAVAGGMANVMQSDWGAQAMKTAASNACNAVNLVEQMFSNLLSELAGIDGKYPDSKMDGTGFAPKLNEILKDFRDTVHKSKGLAVDIATYGQRFDEVIIKMVKDPALDDKKRIEKLDQFIQKATSFETDSAAIEQSYTNCVDKMATFVGNFKNWASPKEDELRKEISDLTKQIQDLESEIQTKRNWMIGLGVAAGVALPLTGIIACCSGPFAPAVMIVGGVITAGLAISAVALAFVIKDLEKDVANKRAQITTINKQITDILNTRAKLELLGNTDLNILKTNVNILSSFWRSAHADARKIKNWLEGGKADADTPDYIHISTDHAVNIYQVMALYLTEYAKGIDSSNIPKP